MKKIPSKLKRRYNTVYRLRKLGYRIGTETHAIAMTEQEYHDLPTAAKRYTDILAQEYHYSVQMAIPDAVKED